MQRLRAERKTPRRFSSAGLLSRGGFDCLQVVDEPASRLLVIDLGRRHLRFLEVLVTLGLIPANGFRAGQGFLCVAEREWIDVSSLGGFEGEPAVSARFVSASRDGVHARHLPTADR